MGDLLIAGITIALYGYVAYVVITTPVGVVKPFQDEHCGEHEAATAGCEPEASVAPPAVEAIAPPVVEAVVAQATAAPVLAAEEATVEVEAEAQEYEQAEEIAEEEEAASPGSATLVLRHPGTGETAVVPANYRFAKKWVKKALVTEGLLDKVYKNNELDSVTSERVKTALEKLKTLEKYHA